MSTITAPNVKTPSKSGNLVEMNWDPITRIVGSLGIFTKIDFENRRVAECHSTSSIFRGYSIFMKGKDPRDAHFITSRICGICGDNHATCATYAQNMAFGVRPPALGEWIVNLGEAAEYMFDHNIFQDNLVGVDFCEQMVKETNPSVWAKAEKTPAPHASLHGYKTIGDIMKALNPFTGEFYLEALQMSRMTREMFCLMEGRHVHPSTLYPGGVGTVPTVQLFTDYIVRLMKYVEFMKKVVPFHDDLFDFFYEALPGYEEVGRRRILLACWGSFNDPDHCDYTYKNMTEWGRKMFVTPGVVVDGELVTTDLVDINLNIRILLGSSYYDDWQGGQTFVKQDPLGNPVDQRHPWNQTTTPRPQKRDFKDKYTWVMSPRWFDKRTGDYLALDTGGGPIARFWATALAGLVDFGYVKSTGHSVKIYLPKTASKPEVEFEWKIPKWSNAIERDRARTYFQAYAAAAALHFAEKAWRSCTPAGRVPGRTSPFPRKPSAAASMKRSAVSCRITSSSRTARSQTITPIRPRRGTPTRAIPTARRVRTKTRCRTRRSSKRTAVISSRASTSCARCAASTPACLAAYICTMVAARSSRRAILRCSEITTEEPMPPPADFQQRLKSIETLLGEIEAGADPHIRTNVQELVQLVMDLHGAGLERMLELIRAPGDGGEILVDKLGRDDLVAESAGLVRAASR